MECQGFRMWLRLEIMNKMEAVKGINISEGFELKGWWLVDGTHLQPRVNDIIEGPFDSRQELTDFYIRMDYIYE